MRNDLGMINGPDNLNRKGADQRPVKVDPKTRTAAPSGASGGVDDATDRVSLSPAAEAILETSNTGAAKSEHQRDLSAIKQEIAEGRYQIDAKQIAEKLIQHETLLQELQK